MKRALASVLLVLAIAPGAAAGQVAAPAPVEEDLAPDDLPAPLQAMPAHLHAEPAPRALAAPAPERPARGAAAAAGRPAPARAEPPSAPPPAAIAAEPPRAIEPVRARLADVREAWHARRRALRESDVPRAAAAERRLLALAQELGVEDLFDLAAAEARGSARALDARLPAEAVARAELAVALAPDLPAAHVALARARLARDPARPGPAAAALGAAAEAAWREPHARAALLAPPLAAAVAAVGAAAFLTLALLVLRRVRPLLHDARHLPVVRHATPLQAGFLCLVALALPLAFGLGAAVPLALAVLAAGLHFGRAERAVATAALVALAALPLLAERSARAVSFAGTLADDVDALERGADDGAAAARVAARAAAGALPPAGHLALGRWHKRRGELDDAARAYAAAGGDRADALVNRGNVLFLRGDVAGARAAYLAAVDRAGADPGTLAAAHYDLAKTYVREAALEQAHEARRKAALEDAALFDRQGTDDDHRANRYLVDVPVRPAELRLLARDDDAARAAAEGTRAALAGGLPEAGWPALPLLVGAALWPVAALRRRIAPSRACERCGRSACRRCDGVAGALCGQCVHVFVKRGAVDPRDRARKTEAVRRHGALARASARALAILAGGAAHLWRGEPVRGALLLLLTAYGAALAAVSIAAAPVAGPHPVPGLAAAGAALAVPLAVGAWAAAVRGVFRRTRARG